MKYEANRVPVGVNHILGALHVRLGKPLEQVGILDAGCGPGNYAKELLDAGIGQIYLLDANDGMLGACKIKLKAYSDNGRAYFVKHKLPTLPYQDEYFDRILLMSVLHHVDKHNFDHLLTTGKEPSYPNLQLACWEAVVGTIFNDQTQTNMVAQVNSYCLEENVYSSNRLSLYQGCSTECWISGY